MLIKTENLTGYADLLGIKSIFPTNLSNKQKDTDMTATNQEFVFVDKKALKTLLQALISPTHHTRELQMTRSPAELFPDNPINILIDNYENQAQYNKEALSRERTMMNALIEIADIEDELFGGDWDEIEQARNIASKAITECYPDYVKTQKS